MVLNKNFTNERKPTNQSTRHSPTPATNPTPLPTLRKAIPEQYPMTGNKKTIQREKRMI
jgi:hypothetical protein